MGGKLERKEQRSNSVLSYRTSLSLLLSQGVQEHRVLARHSHLARKDSAERAWQKSAASPIHPT